MVGLTSDPNPADITHLWFFYHQLKIQFWLIFICFPFKYIESNAAWPISHLKWVSSCDTWRAVAPHITKPGTLGSPTVRRLSGRAGQPEVGSRAPGSIWDDNGGIQAPLGHVQSGGTRFIIPSSMLLLESAEQHLQAAEARRTLQPTSEAGWSGYNREQVLPFFSSMAWLQNCWEALLYNILDVLEQSNLLFSWTMKQSSFFNVL